MPNLKNMDLSLPSSVRKVVEHLIFSKLRVRVQPQLMAKG
jgi:hypothetical protein